MLRDLRHACRRLLAEPLVSLGVVATLALGVSAAVVMGDIVDRLFLRVPAHIPESQRLVRLYDATPGKVVGPLRIGSQSLQALERDGGAVLDGAAAYVREELSMGRGVSARRVRVVTHSAAYFQVLGLTPYIGRLPAPGDAAAATQVVISHALWRTAFAERSDVLGQRLDIGVDTFEVAAVAPPGFGGIDAEATDLWLPLATRGPRAIYPGWDARNDPLLSNVIARLKVDESPAAAASQLAALLSPLQRPARRSFALALGDVSPTRAPELPADVRVSLWTMGMSALLLLVACGNAGNLLLVRRLRRAQELSIKLALGASRARLVREVLADALVLAAMAGIATLAIALVGSRLVHDVLLPGLDDIAPLDLSRLLWLTVAVSFGAALVLSLAPTAWQARQRLTGQAVVTRVSRPSRVLGTFVALQVALSLPLMAAAALFVSSFRNARAQDFGFQADRVVVVETNTAEVGQPRAAHAVHTAIRERVRHIPGVEAAAVVQASPTQGRMGFRVRPRHSPIDEPRMASLMAADASYASVAGIRMVDGRALRDTDDVPGGVPVVMVSASLARDAWPGRSAVGECLEMIGPTTECLTVVGVFADVAGKAALDWRNGALGDWAVVGPLEVMGGTFSGRVLLVKTHAEPASMLASIRREAQQAVPNQPYIDVWPLDDVFEPMLRSWRLGSTVFVAFGVLTLVIAGVGLAVVTAYAVTRRTREIGIRAALGAAPADLVVLLVRQHLWAVGAGVVAGTGLTWLGGRWLQSLLYGVSPHDPHVIAFVGTVLIVTTTLAAWLPARRAGSVDPSAALRVE